MNTAAQRPPPGFVAYAPMRRVPDSYSALVAKYGKEAFAKACAESKTSPLSVQEILERNAKTKQSAKHFDRLLSGECDCGKNHP